MPSACKALAARLACDLEPVPDMEGWIHPCNHGSARADQAAFGLNEEEV